MKASKKALNNDLKTARNFIVAGFVIMLFSLYPIFLIIDFPKESDLTKIKDVLIDMRIKKQSKGARQLELTLKTFPEKLTVSDIAYKESCQDCSDLNIGDSIFIKILKEKLIRNKVYSIRNKQKEILIFEEYKSANNYNNKKFIFVFILFGLIAIGLGIWMKSKILASR